MKKAMLEQLMLGFVLFAAISLFVATINDERATRDRIYDLRSIAEEVSKAMAGYYQEQIDMCYAELIATNILRETPTGRFLDDNNLISFQWQDLRPDWNNDNVGDDGEPDTLVTTIARHDFPTFWYRFFEIDAFEIGPIVHTESINTPRNVTITYGGEDAGFTNMVGTYQLDNNNCVTNTQLILANSDDHSKVGTKIGNTIQSPPTYIFIMPNGYQKFQSKGYTPKDNDIVDITNHCYGSNTHPDISIGNKSLGNNSRMYFEQTELNPDDYEHIQIIPSTLWDFYNDFVNGTGEFSHQGTRTYDEFISYCDGRNSDDDPTNDINCIDDPHDQYQYAMEDLDNGGDEDFNDIFLNTTRVVIPNELNDYTVNQADGNINLTCDNNIRPTVDLLTCPITMNEDEGPITISYSSSDSDGTVMSTDAAADAGATNITGNENSGTIDYTPNVNYYGTDKITVQATDNDNGSGFAYCDINIIEVNDPPEISGTPDTSVNVGVSYNFTPIATDPDDDNLTFSISNKPSWASFDSSTGTLAGVPSQDDVGDYNNIVISVSDGRGGQDSLDPFNIEVVDENLAPETTGIPDDSTPENQKYTYDISSYFSDPNGDQLTYSIESFNIEGEDFRNSIDSQNGIINVNKIPNNTAGQKIQVTVKATDPGELSVTSTYTLTITNLPFFLHTFTTNDENWNGSADEEWIKENGEGKLKITTKNTNKERESSYIFKFGNEFKDSRVRVEFDLEYSGGWEDSNRYQDFFFLDLNDKRIIKESPGNGNGHRFYSFTTKTRANSGDVKVSIGLDVTSKSEILKIDNVKVSIIE